MKKITEIDIYTLIEKALEIKVNTIVDNPEVTHESFEAWDSLGQISILVALDKLFDGKIAAISEMASANSVSKIIEILKKNSLI